MRHRFRYAAISILIASVPIVLTVLGRRESTEPGEIAEPLFEMIVYGIAQWLSLIHISEPTRPY